MSADSSLPKHIAIIMDGNGRWAKQRSLPRIAGHRAGVDAARAVVKACAKRQIQVLTLFAFSSENWRRPPEEVGYLMELFLTGLESEMGMLHQHHIQLRFIGDRSHFSQKLQSKIQEVEQLTQHNTGMVLMVAADYGGKWDICQAVRRIAQAVERGELVSSAVTEEHISHQLSFADLPDPDLFIRTSGEVRISNFMLWQLAYTELYFSDVLWPDFTDNHFEAALLHYAQRERRFGARSTEVHHS